MLALSIRQPFAELILRGIKTVEYRTRAARIIGERFHIYASKKWAVGSRQMAGNAWSRDLGVPGDALPEWMIELAEQVGMIEPGALLPTGVIVGSAVIEKVTRIEHPHPNPLPEGEGMYAWHLADVQRARKFRKPTGHPQPVWFNPFNPRV